MATKTDHGRSKPSTAKRFEVGPKSVVASQPVYANTQSDASCLLRIDFPGGAGEESLRQIEWDEFFDIFEKNNRAMIYQEKTAGAGISRFSKFISRE